MSLVPKASVGLVTGMQNVSLSLAGIAGPLLSGWLLQTTGSYTAPMEAVLFFLVVGAVACIVLLREQWAPLAVNVAALPSTSGGLISTEK